MSSPVLFTLYKDACRSCYTNNHFFKISDDTTILSLLKKNHDISDHFRGIQRVVKWCNDSHLVLNVNKTEEVVFDPRVIAQVIAQVQSNKYPGVFIDNALTWNTLIDSFCCKLTRKALGKHR